jgi:uncharacterized protein (DUF2164 family)
MKEITFSKAQRESIVAKVKAYFNTELQQEIGGFEAEFLLDFFAGEIGACFYNQGLRDAQQILNERVEELNYLLQEIEQPEN